MDYFIEKVDADSITIGLGVSVYADDGVDNAPDVALVFLTRKEIESYADEAENLKQRKFYKTEKFDYSPDWLQVDWDAESSDNETDPSVWLSEGVDRIDVVLLQIRESGTISWRGDIKHTTVGVETKSIDIELLLSEMDKFGKPEHSEHKEMTEIETNGILANLSGDVVDDLENEISEAISTVTGFCHKSFTWELKVEAELDKSE